MVWIGLIWLGKGPVEGSCEHGNESSVSIKCWEVLELLHNWKLLKKCTAPWVCEWVSACASLRDRYLYRLCIDKCVSYNAVSEKVPEAQSGPSVVWSLTLLKYSNIHPHCADKLQRHSARNNSDILNSRHVRSLFVVRSVICPSDVWWHRCSYTKLSTLNRVVINKQKHEKI
jgi:hypothetical protein